MIGEYKFIRCDICLATEKFVEDEIPIGWFRSASADICPSCMREIVDEISPIIKKFTPRNGIDEITAIDTITGAFLCAVKSKEFSKAINTKTQIKLRD